MDTIKIKLIRGYDSMTVELDYDELIDLQQDIDCANDLDAIQVLEEIYNQHEDIDIEGWVYSDWEWA